MGKILLNNAFELEYPDGFHVMDEEEKKQLSFAKEAEGECLKDDERHVMISIAWQKLGGFTDLMLNSRDFAKNVKGSIKKLLKASGFAEKGNLSRKIAGLKSDGFAYTYNTPSRAMYGETHTFKNDKYVYYFYYYAREDEKEINAPVWEQILDSVKLK